MAQLKQIHLLTDVGEKEKGMMDHAALEHARHGNITFKILKNLPDKVVIRVQQGKSSIGVYHSQKRLIEIVHETFGRFFSGKKINVHAIPYKQPACNVVDPGWIHKQMLDRSVRVSDISDETGLNKTQLTSVITGDRPLSQPMKALFWYYFKAKD